VESKII